MAEKATVKGVDRELDQKIRKMFGTPVEIKRVELRHERPGNRPITKIYEEKYYQVSEGDEKPVVKRRISGILKDGKPLTRPAHK